MNKQKIIEMVDAYWKFDESQQPMSSWHDKQDLLKAIEGLQEEKEVSDADIENAAEKCFPFEKVNSTNTYSDSYNYPKRYGFKVGAKALRDNLIKKGE